MTHNHHHHDDQHDHRNVDVIEAPMDAANRSLSDALRASFSILKGIMMVIVVLYLFSNVRRVDSHEEALVLRLGRLLPEVQQAGLVWAMPFPLDEIVPLPTKQSNTFTVESHTFQRRPQDRDKPLSFISWPSGMGLHPSLDGALMTADGGLVHTKWKITYKIDRVDQYVSNVRSRQTEAAEALIRTFVETCGIHVGSEVTADELIRTRVEYVQDEITHRVNQRLASIDSGILVTRIEMHEPTPPIAVRDSFDATQRAENVKQKRLRDAEQTRDSILNEAGGEAGAKLLAVLNAIDDGGTPEQPLSFWRGELDRVLLEEAEGNAGRMIKDAGAYLAIVSGQMQSDVELYRTLLPEYKRNPHLLVNRLWEQTKQGIFTNPSVTKVYRPGNSPFRIHIGLDPDHTRQEEARRLQEKRFDPASLMPTRVVPLGPDSE